MKTKTGWLVLALITVGIVVAVVGPNQPIGWSGSLTADQELEFVVTDASTGKPIANATVALYAFDNHMGNPDWVILTTDDEGRAFYFRADCDGDETVRYGKATLRPNLGWCDLVFVRAEGYEQAGECPWQAKNVGQSYSREDGRGRFHLTFRFPLRKGNAGPPLWGGRSGPGRGG
jgi:hypothetical protein